MFIAKNKDLIILAKNTREELEESLKYMNYTSIEETQNEYELYNGEYLTKEEIAEKERRRIANLSLTKREIFLALYNDKGITPDEIKNQITPPQALIEFEYAMEYYRSNPLIDTIGATLGYTPEDLDYLFEHKSFPLKKTV